ncbi:MAG: hypothetical protein ACI9OJ_001886 [Myxococcota bacterium]|jgi:hypothetical protein
MSWTEIIIALAVGLFFGMVQPTLSWFGERARRSQLSESAIETEQPLTGKSNPCPGNTAQSDIQSKKSEGVNDE